MSWYCSLLSIRISQSINADIRAPKHSLCWSIRGLWLLFHTKQHSTALVSVRNSTYGPLRGWWVAKNAAVLATQILFWVCFFFLPQADLPFLLLLVPVLQGEYLRAYPEAENASWSNTSGHILVNNTVTCFWLTSRWLWLNMLLSMLKWFPVLPLGCWHFLCQTLKVYMHSSPKILEWQGHFICFLL